jgi:parallel beta-helix repeat protein
MLRARIAFLALALACGGEPGTGPGPTPGPGPSPEPEPEPGAECAPATVLCPGETLATEVNAAPEGTAFRLREGVYRLQQFSPKAGQSFTGEPGAVLVGARLLTEWAREGSYWVHAGQVEQGEVRLPDACQDTRPGCALPEELFIDDQVLQRVTTVQGVSAGAWYFDYASDKIYTADDPTGKKVEISVLPWAIFSAASHVTVEGLIVEKYASPTQRGAIGFSGPGSDWVLRGNEVRSNHGAGIRLADRMQVLNNFIQHQGQIGIAGSGSDVLVQGNEIAFNNTAGFGLGPQSEAGATKFTFTNRLVVRDNFSHHNHGPGLWTDIDNHDCLYEGNRVEDNDWRGIFHEISYACVIRNNMVRNNGHALPAGGSLFALDGAGILVSSSADVEVYGNVVEDNRNGIGAIDSDRGNGTRGPYEVANLWVHDNAIQQRSGVAAGILGSNPVFLSKRNRFTGNSYLLGDTALRQFRWLHANRSDEEWRGFGNDTTGMFSR